MELDQFDNFALEIEEIVWTKDVSYIDAVILWCEGRKIEFEVAGKLVKKNKILMAKMHNDAEELNYLPKEPRLPL